MSKDREVESCEESTHNAIHPLSPTIRILQSLVHGSVKRSSSLCSVGQFYVLLMREIVFRKKDALSSGLNSSSFSGERGRWR